MVLLKIKLRTGLARLFIYLLGFRVLQGYSPTVAPKDARQGKGPSKIAALSVKRGNSADLLFWKSRFWYLYRPEGIYLFFFFGLILDPPPRRYICFYSEKKTNSLAPAILSGLLNRLNARLSLLQPLDRYRTTSAIGSAIGRPLSRPISHPNTGGSPQPPRSKPLGGLNRAIVVL